MSALVLKTALFIEKECVGVWVWGGCERERQCANECE